MQLSQRFGGLVLATAVAAGVTAFAATALPAAARTDCASNTNIRRVHDRLDGTIDRLTHDQRDYGGHKANAIRDLANARGELYAAAQYAIENDHENPACIRSLGSIGDADANRGTRTQRGSNIDMARVAGYVERLIDQLNGDQRDYGGHRVNAIRDMQAARSEIAAAEQFARARGY